MGYGQNLKDILDNKSMTVKELALKAKIAPTTLYSIRYYFQTLRNRTPLISQRIAVLIFIIWL